MLTRAETGSAEGTSFQSLDGLCWCLICVPLGPVWLPLWWWPVMGRMDPAGKRALLALLLFPSSCSRPGVGSLCWHLCSLHVCPVESRVQCWEWRHRSHGTGGVHAWDTSDERSLEEKWHCKITQELEWGHTYSPVLCHPLVWLLISPIAPSLAKAATVLGLSHRNLQVIAAA